MNLLKGNQNSQQNSEQDQQKSEEQNDKKPEFRFMVVFSPTSICDMYDIYEEQFNVPGTDFATSKFVSALAIQYPENGDKMVKTKLGGKGYDKIFFVDCSRVKAEHFLDSTYFITPETSFTHFLRELKGHLVRLRLQPNGCPNGANVHLTVCAYHPMEALMFATQKFFKNTIADADEYKDFVNYAIDSNRRGGGGRFIKHIESWLNAYHWNIDVEYCSIYVGHQLVTTDPYKAKINKLKGLIQEVSDWNDKTSKGKSPQAYEKALDEMYKRNYLRMGHYSIGGYDNEIWERTGQGRSGASVPDYCTERTVLAQYEDGQWYTQRELLVKLKELIEPVTDPEKIKKWCDEQDKLLKEKKRKQYDPKIAEIDEKLRILKERRSNTFENQVLKDTYSDDPHGPTTINYDYIEYQGRLVTKDELTFERKRLLTRYNQEKQKIKNIREIGDKLKTQQRDAIISLVLAIAATAWAPLALLDVGFEVYKMVRDDDGFANHALSFGLDAVALIPVAGGALRLTSRGMGIGSETAKIISTTEKNVIVAKGNKTISFTTSDYATLSKAKSDIGVIKQSVVASLKNSAAEFKGGGYKDAFVPKLYNLLENVGKAKGIRKGYILADAAADTYTRWSIVKSGFLMVKGKHDEMSLEEFWAEVTKIRQ